VCKGVRLSAQRRARVRQLSRGWLLPYSTCARRRVGAAKTFILPNQAGALISFVTLEGGREHAALLEARISEFPMLSLRLIRRTLGPRILLMVFHSTVRFSGPCLHLDNSVHLDHSTTRLEVALSMIVLADARSGSRTFLGMACTLDRCVKVTSWKALCPNEWEAMCRMCWVDGSPPNAHAGERKQS
jgi:hypothetical protein